MHLLPMSVQRKTARVHLCYLPQQSSSIKWNVPFWKSLDLKFARKTADQLCSRFCSWKERFGRSSFLALQFRQWRRWTRSFRRARRPKFGSFCIQPSLQIQNSRQPEKEFSSCDFVASYHWLVSFFRLCKLVDFLELLNFDNRVSDLVQKERLDSCYASLASVLLFKWLAMSEEFDCWILKNAYFQRKTHFENLVDHKLLTKIAVLITIDAGKHQLLLVFELFFSGLKNWSKLPRKSTMR